MEPIRKNHIHIIITLIIMLVAGVANFFSWQPFLIHEGVSFFRYPFTFVVVFITPAVIIGIVAFLYRNFLFKGVEGGEGLTYSKAFLDIATVSIPVVLYLAVFNLVPALQSHEHNLFFILFFPIQLLQFFYGLIAGTESPAGTRFSDWSNFLLQFSVFLAALLIYIFKVKNLSRKLIVFTLTSSYFAALLVGFLLTAIIIKHD